jgi:hypothetical protein
VERELTELERLCAALERDLVGGRWKSAENALRDMRRVTHGYLNALQQAQEVRDEAFDAAVTARLQRVMDARQNQLARLETFHENLRQRLETLSRWKTFARSIGAKRGRRASLGLDSVR